MVEQNVYAIVYKPQNRLEGFAVGRNRREALENYCRRALYADDAKEVIKSGFKDFEYGTRKVRVKSHNIVLERRV